MPITIDTDLGKQIQEKSGQNAYLCYQCKKCTAGCPMADHFDLTPAQLLRALQFGQVDKVLHSRTMWLCAYCETCVTRCPMDIDLPRIMDTLKGIAAAQGIKASEPLIGAFNAAAINWINRAGRIHDVGLMAEVNMRVGQPLRDAGLGLRMFTHGKVRLLPEIKRQPKKLPRPAPKHGKSRRVGYFPGCTLHCSGVEYDESTRAVAPVLGLELVEIKDWVCCGSGAAHQVSRELAAELPMKNLAMAEAAGEDEVTLPCSACYSRFKAATHEVSSDQKLHDHVASKLGYDFKGTIKVKNIIDTLTERVGLDEIESKVKRPLAGLKTVCYYGCLLSRPPQITGVPDAEYPMSMDRIVQRLGAETLDWSYKTECCGASLMITQTERCLPLAERILANAKAVGAQAIVVACSFCQLNLDMRQQTILEKLGRQYDLPIIYFTQLMGLAFGLSPKELGLGKHFVKADGVLGRLGIARS